MASNTRPESVPAAPERVTFSEHGIRHAFQHEDARAVPAEAFLRLNFVSVYVADQERSKAFFVEQLGFELLLDTHFPSGYRWIEVAPPDGTARLALVRPAPGFCPAARPGASSLITFMSGDVDAQFRRWSARGVKFPQPPHTPEWGGRYCTFEDPDGNRFGVAGFGEVAQALDSRRQLESERRAAERLAAQELAIAQTVQARLLPQGMPKIAGLDCAAACVQARSVGGDYYDFIELDRDRVAFVVADVAGKGIAAALLMANLQAALRGQCAAAAGHPERALAQLNRMLFNSSEPSAYATLLYAEYAAGSGRLRYANCGHLAGLLLSRRGELRRLPSTATVVGLFENWSCQMEEARMAPGDLLALYTDGVVEAFNADQEQFGEARLAAILRRHQDEPAARIVAAVVSAVAGFSSSAQQDDVTIAIAKRLHPASGGAPAAAS